MQRVESEQRSIINLLIVGILILVMAVIAIMTAFSHQQREEENHNQLNTYGTSEPLDTPASAPPTQIIQVDRPTVERIPVPVPVTRTETVVREVPVPVRGETPGETRVPLQSAGEDTVHANPTPSTTNGPDAMDTNVP